MSFTQPDGERPLPLCVAARELFSRRLVTIWLEGRLPPPQPWSTGPDTLFVAYYASAEIGCCLALGWPFPQRVLDLYAEFRCRHSGLSVPAGFGLLGALTAYGLPGIASVDKEDMRALAKRGRPYTAHEREALLVYCQSDIDGLD